MRNQGFTHFSLAQLSRSVSPVFTILVRKFVFAFWFPSRSWKISWSTALFTPVMSANSRSSACSRRASVVVAVAFEAMVPLSSASPSTVIACSSHEGVDRMMGSTWEERRNVPLRMLRNWSSFMISRASTVSLSPSKSPPMPIIGAFDTLIWLSPMPLVGSVVLGRESSSEMNGWKICIEFGLSEGLRCSSVATDIALTMVSWSAGSRSHAAVIAWFSSFTSSLRRSSGVAGS